jgi:SWI/SNF-related matrix-associated actin-dependent regulator 1 of chromatin subfamily A
MTNRYPGTCHRCKARVAVSGGSAAKVAGQWVVYCSVCVPVAAAPAVPAGPTRIVVAMCDGEVRFAPSAFLGGDLFARYREAVAGLRYHAADRSQRSGDLALVGRALARLQAAGLLIDVAPEVAAAVQAEAASDAVEVASADERAVAVDAVLKARGLALFPFQAIGVSWLAPRTGALLADEMGLGKTIQALTALPERAAVLVVCPAVAKGVWQRECAKWRPDLTPVVLKGKGSFRWPAAGELVVINYDILPALEGEGRAAALTAALAASCPTGVVLVADEAHALKGGKTARSTRFRAISKRVRELAGRCWLVSATPLLNRPVELWHVCAAAGIEKEAFGSWNAFAAVAGGREGRYGMEWEPERMNRDALMRQLQRVMLLRKKVEVLKDLPAKTYSEVTIEIPAKIAKLCDAALAAAEARGQTVEAALELAQRSKGATPGFEAMSKARAALALAKCEAALELVESFEEAGEPIVVFSAHRAPIDALGTRPGWAAITGETSPEERTRIADAFQAGQLKGVAATIKAGGVAITLTRATNAIFIDQAWTPSDNVQAEDRIYRIGTTKPVVITQLVADHALDQRIYELLARKREFIRNSVDAAKRGAEEVVGAEAADLDAAAAALVQAQADLELKLAAQRKAAAARQAAQEARDATEAASRAQREADKQEGAARSRARQAMSRRGHDVSELDLLDVRRGPVSEREIWAAQALVTLAGDDPDRAREKNLAGFNRADGAHGHDLASRLDEGLVEVEWQLAVVLCAKYWAQVGPMPGGPIDRAEKAAVAS